MTETTGNNRFVARLLLVGCALFLPASVVDAAWTQTLDYFETQVAGACMATNVGVPGSYVRQYRDPVRTCSGMPVYQIVHGSTPHPWADENFYVQGGYLKQMSEIYYNPVTGAMTSYRVFRDLASFTKGIQMMPTSFQSSFFFYQAANREEMWTTPSGPACAATQLTWVNGSLNWHYMAHLGTWPNYIQDRRSVSADPNAWHDIDVILRTDQWGTNFYDQYYYARWQNPVTGAWQGLGLVLIEVYQGSSLVYRTEHRQLVDCSVAVSCSTCPP